MVGGDMADRGDVMRKEPAVGVIVVQIGYPLPRLAAKFPEIVPRSSARDQCKVYRYARFMQPIGNCHGDMVHPDHMFHQAERGHLPGDPQKLIDILLPEDFQQAPVILCMVASGEILLGDKPEIVQTVKRQGLFFVGKKHLQKLKQEPGAVVVFFGTRSKFRIRKHQVAGKQEGKLEPSFLRLRGEPVQQIDNKAGNLPAVQAFLDRQNLSQQGGPVGIVHQGGHRLFGYREPLQELASTHRLGKIERCLSDQFLGHRVSSISLPGLGDARQNFS